MNSIVVGFSTPKSWLEPFSWLIRLLTWAPMSHAYIRYYDGYSQSWVIFQASGLKVNLVGQTMFDSAETVVAEFEIPVSDATKQKVVQNAIGKLGAPYGVLQIVGFVWVLFMRIFGKKVSNPLYSANSFFCSELTDEELQEMGMNGLDPSASSPKDLYNSLLSKGLKPNA